MSDILHCHDCKHYKDDYCLFWGQEVSADKFCYRAEKIQKNDDQLKRILDNVIQYCKKMSCDQCKYYDSSFLIKKCTIAQAIGGPDPAAWRLSYLK